MNVEKIQVEKNGNVICYCVPGDIIKYLDLESLKRSHPELNNFIDENHFELKRKLLQTKEINSERG